MSRQPDASINALVIRYRKDAGLTQEDLAELAGISARAISDLERGLTWRPRKDTTRRLAGGLKLTGLRREEVETAARGRRPAGGHQLDPAGAEAAAALAPATADHQARL